jgi:hypothetical protein
MCHVSKIVACPVIRDIFLERANAREVLEECLIFCILFILQHCGSAVRIAFSRTKLSFSKVCRNNPAEADSSLRNSRYSRSLLFERPAVLRFSWFHSVIRDKFQYSGSNQTMAAIFQILSNSSPVFNNYPSIQCYGPTARQTNSVLPYIK